MTRFFRKRCAGSTPIGDVVLTVCGILRVSDGPQTTEVVHSYGQFVKGMPPKGMRTEGIRTRRYTNQGIRTKNTILFKFILCRFAAHTVGVRPACPFPVLAPDPVAPPNTTIAISTPVSTTIYLPLSLSAQQPRTRHMQQDTALTTTRFPRETN